MTSLYYTPPSNDQFDELKAKVIEIWKEVADHPGYLREKLDRVEGVTNVGDNFMYLVAMFDIHNQAKLAGKLSADTREAVRDRMIDGRQPTDFIVF